jgi:transcriptional regulator with XRE-family HTH domain
MANDFDKELVAFGKRVREIRKHRKLTLVSLEVLTGIGNSKLSRIERGLVNIELQTVHKLAKALRVTIKLLFDYNGEMPAVEEFKNPFPQSSKKRR